MTNSNPQSDQFDDRPLDDELLSAYVDGELTDEELTHVEQRLATDAAAQQLVEELRAMSQQLQSLPTATVGEDLRSTIMQRAERSMLLGTEEQTVATPRNTAAQRRWVWAAFAVAASLLLATFLPTTEVEKQPIASAKPAEGGEATDAARELPSLGPPMAPMATDEVVRSEISVAENEAAEAIAASRSELEASEPVPMAMADEEKSLGDSLASSAPGTFRAGANIAELDTMQFSCTVHITLNDQGDNDLDSDEDQFAELLAKNGIALQSESDSPTRLRGAGESLESEALNDKMIAKKQRRSESSEQLYFVEAPAEPIENVLEVYNADMANVEEVRVTQQQLPQQPAQQLSVRQLQNWSRSGKQSAQQQLNQKALSRARKGKASIAKQATRGWATRLEANQYQAGKLNLDQKTLDQQGAYSGVEPEPPLQVLFILQRATPGKAAATGGEPPSSSR